MSELLEARRIITDRIIDTCLETDGRREGLREAVKIIDDLLNSIIGEEARYHGEA